MSIIIFNLALVNIYQSFTVTLYQSEPVHKTLETFDLVLRDFPKECQPGSIYLVEKPSMVNKDYEAKEFCLYKYSNVKQMAGELIYIYSFLTGRKAIPMQQQDVRIVAFGAVEGGAGCTSVAMAFAQELKRFHDIASTESASQDFGRACTRDHFNSVVGEHGIRIADNGHITGSVRFSLQPLL